ncbi:hypothetical protein IAR55_002787 [Kwoniella newhampshirensis]|uniref:UDENN domain-containing protein n=1 Tax=Kwoniella newhampshirensis TaxID=1651941 RepID=A0AAW0YRU6_9TREE
MSSPSPSPFSSQTPSARSNLTAASVERDFESELGNTPLPDDVDLDGTGGAEQEEEAVHFCLLAEFDIDAGATLAYQYPYPTGTDEHRLAELMLPDGAHLRPEDWTVFYLGQTASSAVAPMLSHESSSASRVSAESDRRASMMPSSRATRGVAGGGLLYVLNCVRMKEDKKMRRGAMVKAMAICTPNPYIGIYKPLLLLALEEYFISPSPEILARLFDSANAISTAGMPKLSRYERILLRSSDRKDLLEEKFGVLEPASGTKETFDETSEAGHNSLEGGEGRASHQKTMSSTSGMRMVRKGSANSSQMHLATPPSSREGRLSLDVGYGNIGRRRGVPRDTHFFETEARFKKITVPIRIPMTVFDEDVGDLVQTFSQHTAPFPAPFHPHLHTNGSLTLPIILILNAMLAHKRVMFLGHGLPANQVARMVLAACALGSGCGQVLRGITESAFPYANLASLDVLEEFSGFVAGVTNPRFEELPMTWDVLCNLETGKVTVSKDLKAGGVGSMKSGRSSETSLSASIVKVEEDMSIGTPQTKMNSIAKADCVDNQFMEEILSAMSSHYGEASIRLRFTDYLSRFVRLAAYQESLHTGTTKIGYPTASYRDGQLGSGAVFADETAKQREMWANGHRIDAWRKTRSYKLYARLLTHLPAHFGGLLPVANGLFHRWAGVRNNALELFTRLQQYPVGRHAVASMNYFHRKTYLQLYGRHEAIWQQQREQERSRTAQNDRVPLSPHVHGGEFASPGTVHGSASTTPQGVSRA